MPRRAYKSLRTVQLDRYAGLWKHGPTKEVAKPDSGSLAGIRRSIQACSRD